MEELFLANLMQLQPDNVFTMCPLLEVLAPALVENALSNGRGVELGHL